MERFLVCGLHSIDGFTWEVLPSNVDSVSRNTIFFCYTMEESLEKLYNRLCLLSAFGFYNEVSFSVLKPVSPLYVVGKLYTYSGHLFVYNSKLDTLSPIDGLDVVIVEP